MVHDKFDLERSHVPATITKVMRAKDEITIWGKGKEKEIYYVDDLVKFVNLVIRKQKIILNY